MKRLIRISFEDIGPEFGPATSEDVERLARHLGYNAEGADHCFAAVGFMCGAFSAIADADHSAGREWLEKQGCPCELLADEGTERGAE